MSDQCELNNGKWTYSSNKEFFNYGEHFNAKENAILAGREYFEDAKFYIGQVEEVGLGVIVDVSSILEHININMCDDAGESADDYLMHTKTEHDKELEEELCNVITRWIEKHNYQPSFFKVINIEGVEEVES